jgi:sialate O-acetylesterase
VSLFVALFIAFVSPSQANELQPAGLFADQMVLQREQPVPLWGWANPGEAITVQFAGQFNTQTANANGRWFVTPDLMAVFAEGRVLIVQSTVGDRKSKLADVVVGYVWLCSGQSNMQQWLLPPTLVTLPTFIPYASDRLESDWPWQLTH